MTNKKTNTDINEKQPIRCFVIMPISKQDGYDADHFDLVYEDIIKPAIKLAGMEPRRADDTVNTNVIHVDILRNVIESDIAICDMSSRNPNVFYELGVRQAFDKPTVLMIDESTVPPFDVANIRFVNYKKAMGYRDVTDVVEKLAQTLTVTYEKRNEKTEINSPIRFMELMTTPAQLNQTDMTQEDRMSIRMSELTSSVIQIQQAQSDILKFLKSDPKTISSSHSSIEEFNQILGEWIVTNSDNNSDILNSSSQPKKMLASRRRL